jgi:hypothetical protein
MVICCPSRPVASTIYRHYRGTRYGGQHATAPAAESVRAALVALVCEHLQPGSSRSAGPGQLEAGGFTGELLVLCSESASGRLRLPVIRSFAAVGRVIDLAVMVLPTHRKCRRSCALCGAGLSCGGAAGAGWR